MQTWKATLAGPLCSEGFGSTGSKGGLILDRSHLPVARREHGRLACLHSPSFKLQAIRKHPCCWSESCRVHGAHRSAMPLKVSRTDCLFLPPHIGGLKLGTSWLENRD